MTLNEYETISAVIASRRKAGDDYGRIRADLEATRTVPFSPEEWAKLRFLAALDVAFSSVPEPTKPAPSAPSKTNTVIRIHPDSSGEYHMSVDRKPKPPEK